LGDRDLLAKASQYLRLAAECPDPRTSKVLRIFAEYLINRAKEEAQQGKKLEQVPNTKKVSQESPQGGY
jgi:ferritin